MSIGGKLMKAKSLILLVTFLAFTFGLLAASAQDQDQDVRGAFLSSRPKQTTPSAPRRPRPPRNNNTSTNTSSTSKNTNTAINANAGVEIGTANTSTNKHLTGKSAGAIGLGYTLFMRDGNNRAVRVEPTRE